MTQTTHPEHDEELDEILRKSMFGHKWSEGNQSHLLKAKAAIVSWALRIVAEARPDYYELQMPYEKGFNDGIDRYVTALKQRLEKEKA